jgi:hypothetical protein
MNNAQNEVIDWWYGRRDYRTGIELLSRYCKNKTIINTLSKHGKENFQASVKKLNYEVTKAVQLDWLHMPAYLSPEQVGEKSLADISPRENQKEEKNNPADTFFPPEKDKKNDDTNQYPRVIRRLKYEYSELYNKKSALHSDMRNVEQANTEKNNEQRSELLSEIKSISKQLAFYYGFLEKYEVNGIVPDEAEIWPPAKEPAPEEPKSLPELKKLMWSLRRENSKDGFRLIYQQRTKAEKENPMPKGAKRDAIELRIKLREIKLAETMTLITQLENAD